MSKLRKSIIILLLFLTIVTASGCISNNHSQTQTNTTITQSTITAISTSTTTTTTPAQEKIVKQLVGDYNKVYYVGYDEELANYKWKIDSYTVYSKNNGAIIITDILNPPQNIIIKVNNYRQYSNSIIKSQVTDKEALIITKGIILKNKIAFTVINLNKNKKNDGYIVIVPNNIITITQPVIIKENHQLKTNGNECNALMKFLIKISNKPLPKNFELSVDYTAGEGVATVDAYYTMQPDRMSIMFTVNLIPQNITLTNTKININYQYKGFTIMSEKVVNYNKIIKTILESCKTHQEVSNNDNIKITINNYSIVDYNPGVKIPNSFGTELSHPVSVKLNMTIITREKETLELALNHEQLMLPLDSGVNRVSIIRTVNTQDGSVKVSLIKHESVTNTQTLYSKTLTPTGRIKDNPITVTINSLTITTRLNESLPIIDKLLDNVLSNTYIGKTPLSKIYNETRRLNTPVLIRIHFDNSTVITNDLLTMIRIILSHGEKATVEVNNYTGEFRISDDALTEVSKLIKINEPFIISTVGRGSNKYYGSVIIKAFSNSVMISPTNTNNIRVVQKLGEPNILYGGIINPYEQSIISVSVEDSNDETVKTGVLVYYNIMNYIPLSGDIKPLVVKYVELNLQPSHNNVSRALPLSLKNGIIGKMFSITNTGEIQGSGLVVSIDLSEALNLTENDYTRVVKILKSNTHGVVTFIDRDNHLILEKVLKNGQNEFTVDGHTISVPGEWSGLVNYTLKVNVSGNDTVFEYNITGAEVNEYHIALFVNGGGTPLIVGENQENSVKKTSLNDDTQLFLIGVNSGSLRVVFPGKLSHYNFIITYPVLTQDDYFIASGKLFDDYIILGNIYSYHS